MPPAVHLAADDGVQAYREPYPRVAQDGSHRAAFIPGRAVVHVQATQGAWAQVSLNDEIVGWVDGSQLIPPLGPRIAQPSWNDMPSVRTTNEAALNIDTVVGVLGGLGILIGSAVDWTQGIAANSFKIPAAFLVDAHTRTRDPRLGYFVLVLGIAGVLLSFVRNARLLRGTVGVAAAGISIIYCAQIATQLSNQHLHASFTDVVGGGPWVTGTAGLLLVASSFVGL